MKGYRVIIFVNPFFFVPQKCQTNKIVGPTFLLTQYFFTRKYFKPKKIWDLKCFGTQMFLDIFRTQFFWNPKNCLTKILMDQNNFGTNKICQIFYNKTLREAFIKKTWKFCFSFGTVIFQPKDFVIWRRKLKCGFVQLYLLITLPSSLKIDWD